mgnify:CR=1 FL=1
MSFLRPIMTLNPSKICLSDRNDDENDEEYLLDQEETALKLLSIAGGGICEICTLVPFTQNTSLQNKNKK